MRHKTISIISPVFNEEAGIQQFVERLIIVCEKTQGYKFQIILVNDGSDDDTSNVLNSLSRKYSLNIVNLPKNVGQQSAILAGLRLAEGSTTIVLDSDLQDPPEYIPNLIKKWETGDDVVMCRRRSREDRFSKKLTASIFYRLIHLIDPRLPVDCGDYYLMDKSVQEKIARVNSDKVYLRGIVARQSKKLTFVNIDRPPRLSGKGNYSFKKMTNLAIAGFLFAVKQK